VYWIAIITGFLVMRYKETTGHLPFMKAKKSKDDGGVLSDNPSSDVSRQQSLTKDPEKNVTAVQAAPARTISE
jgi:high-affinity iron transporter